MMTMMITILLPPTPALGWIHDKPVVISFASPTTKQPSPPPSVPPTSNDDDDDDDDLNCPNSYFSDTGGYAGENVWGVIGSGIGGATSIGSGDMIGDSEYSYFPDTGGYGGDNIWGRVIGNGGSGSSGSSSQTSYSGETTTVGDDDDGTRTVDSLLPSSSIYFSDTGGGSNIWGVIGTGGGVLLPSTTSTLGASVDMDTSSSTITTMPSTSSTTTITHDPCGSPLSCGDSYNDEDDIELDIAVDDIDDEYHYYDEMGYSTSWWNTNEVIDTDNFIF